MWHGLPARETTAKMAVPLSLPINVKHTQTALKTTSFG
jgi:hypothetical protein